MIKDPCSHLYREQKDKKTYIYPWRPNAKEILHVPRENQMIFELRTTEKRTLKKYRRIKSYPWITKEKRTLHLFRENQMIFKPNIYPSRRTKGEGNPTYVPDEPRRLEPYMYHGSKITQIG